MEHSKLLREKAALSQTEPDILLPSPGRPLPSPEVYLCGVAVRDGEVGVWSQHFPMFFRCDTSRHLVTAAFWGAEGFDPPPIMHHLT